MSKSSDLTALVILWAVIMTLYYAMGVNHYPMFDGDPSAFLPYAVDYAKHGTLTNPLWHSSNVFDAENPTNLTWHGFLYPILLGWISPSATYPGLRIVITFLWIATQSLFALVLYRITRDTLHNQSWRALIMGAALLAGCGLLPNGGRPELLVAFVIAASMTLLIMVEYKWHWLINGTAAGLLVATSPVCAILFAPLVGIYTFSRSQPLTAIILQTRVLLVSCVVFTALFWFYPFTLDAWLTGMLLHSQSAIIGGSGGWVDAIRVQPSMLSIILLLLLMCGAGFITLFYKIRDAACSYCILPLVAIIIAEAYYFWIRVPDRSYNAFAYSHLIIIGLIYSIISLTEIKSYSAPRARSIIYGFLCFSLIAASADFIRRAIVFPFFLSDGVAYEDARGELMRLVDKGDMVSVTGGFFSLTEDYSHIEVSAHRDKFKGKWVLRQQTYSGESKAPEINGYTLVNSNFSSTMPTYFGMKIANTCGAYNYAIYRANDL